MDIFDLPFKDNSVDEIRAEAFIEHLSFLRESFYEVKRVLKHKGKINFSTINFEKTVKHWLKLKDDWKDFYKTSKKAISEKHWFGTYTYNYTNKWGYIIASIYGSQHEVNIINCYTKKKLISIFKHLNFIKTKVSEFRWQGKRDFMIRVISLKIKMPKVSIGIILTKT